MPDLSLFKPLCEILNITINELLSGAKLEKENYQQKLEENMVNTINYTSKKISKKNNILGITLLVFGSIITLTAIAIFPSESSWSSIYSVVGAIVAFVGFVKLNRKFDYYKALFLNLGFFVLFMIILIGLDYVNVKLNDQAPRFSLVKVTGENVMYYDTLFYDVIKCNVNKSNETFKIIKNHKYDRYHIDMFCK